MKAFRIKSIHPKVKSHYHNFISSKKIKNIDFEDYLDLSERGREKEDNELNKTNFIEKFQNYKRSRTSYLGKIRQNIKKLTITLDNQIITIKNVFTDWQSIYTK